MRNGKRGRYTLEFKQEAARLVESGQSIAEASRSLGAAEQSLSNWVQAVTRRNAFQVEETKQRMRKTEAPALSSNSTLDGPGYPTSVFMGNAGRFQDSQFARIGRRVF
jgi:transposase-like protein